MSSQQYPQRYKDKIVVITAASTGIGFGMAKRFAMEGATVIISSRSQKNVDEAVEEVKKMGGKADGVVAHAGKPSDRKVLLDFVQKKYGGIDVLVPNAAVSTFFGPFLDTNEKQMDKMFEVNFKGVFFLIQEALPLMEGRKGANIICMSSYTAYDPANEIGFYSITKSMLTAMTKMVARQLASDNIRCNCICPGLIRTNFSKALYEGREKQVLKENGIQRIGVPEDIANMAAFLGSSEADFITGESFLVAGKATSRL